MTEKLKILCLHGYLQNATRFSNQTGSLRKILKNEADLYYLSAPNVVPYPGYGEGDEEQLRAWWFSRHSSFSSRDDTDQDKGLSESLEKIKAKFNNEGPFHGILGFSQGAALVGILCALKQRNEINLDFKFAIIVSGFKSKSTVHSDYYNQKININSLHVIGETDQIITTDMCYGLAEIFVNPVIMLHPGGHFVPGKSSFKANYVDFLQAQKALIGL